MSTTWAPPAPNDSAGFLLLAQKVFAVGTPPSLHSITTRDNPAFRASAETAASLHQSLPHSYTTEAAEFPVKDVLGHQPSLVKEGSMIKAYTEGETPRIQHLRIPSGMSST